MRGTDRLVVVLVLSGGGHLVHNVGEFGVGTIAAEATLVPTAITATLIVAVRRRISRGLLSILAAWAVVVLVVGGGSVFPLRVLPFEPDQSSAHYVAHGAYALLQVPLLVVTARTLGERRGCASRRLALQGVPLGRSWCTRKTWSAYGTEDGRGDVGGDPCPPERP